MAQEHLNEIYPTFEGINIHDEDDSDYEDETITAQIYLKKLSKYYLDFCKQHRCGLMQKQRIKYTDESKINELL